MNTIDDKQNEMYCLYHYNEFEYNHDFFEIFSITYNALNF